MTPQQLAELAGMTYQQMQKYEAGINCVSAGLLHRIAQALGVEVGHFFVDMDAEGHGLAEPAGAPGQRRRLLELVRHAADIRDPKHREALCQLARELAALGAGDPGSDPQVERPRPPPEPQPRPDRWLEAARSIASVCGGRAVDRLMAGGPRAAGALRAAEVADQVRRRGRAVVRPAVDEPVGAAPPDQLVGACVAVQPVGPGAAGEPVVVVRAGEILDAGQAVAFGLAAQARAGGEVDPDQGAEMTCRTCRVTGA